MNDFLQALPTEEAPLILGVLILVQILILVGLVLLANKLKAYRNQFREQSSVRLGQLKAQKQLLAVAKEEAQSISPKVRQWVSQLEPVRLKKNVLLWGLKELSPLKRHPLMKFLK